MIQRRQNQQTQIVNNGFNERQLLGQGTFGKVYKITENNITYVVKQISKLTVRRNIRQNQLKRQVQIMKMINHQNIVTFYDFRDKKDSPYYELILQYCEGTSLKNFLFDPQKYLKLVVQKNRSKYFAIKVCLDYINALTQIRSKMISNRDIKPDNIVIQQLPNSKFKAKMIDLGQARIIIQKAMSFVGSNQYMAPEIKFGNGKSYSQACDLWSLGETMYQIFQGLRFNLSKKPYLCSAFKQNFQPKSDKDFLNYYNKYIFQGISFDKQLTPGPFRQVIRQLLRVDPEQRIKFYEMLVKLLEGFEQYEDCFNQEQKKNQKKRLSECITKQKQTEYRKKNIKIQLQNIKQIFFAIIKKVHENLQQKQYSRYLDAIRLIIFSLRKLREFMNEIVKNIGHQQQLNQQNEQFVKKQILCDVLSSEECESIIRMQNIYYKYIRQNDIQIQFNFSGISENLNSFILTKFGVLCLPILESINRIFHS